MTEQRGIEGWLEALRRIEETKRFGAKNLDLSGLTLTAVPDSIAEISDLVTLDLRVNQLDILPASISDLTSLQALFLGNNRLSKLPTSLAQLSKLRTFDLEANRLRALPDFIADLSNLQDLKLSGNQLSALPDSITHLRSLEMLDLSNNQLSILPDAIAQLCNLRILNLSNNQLGVLPDSIVQIENLQRLYLSGNQLSALPDSISQLCNLQTVDLSNNRLTSVPSGLARISELAELFLHGNPDLGIPNEILGPGRHGRESPKPAKEILYYVSRLADAKPLNEAKLIMVGQGGVGKTSLVKKLTTGKFNPRERATEGIKIKDWAIPLSTKNKVTIHIWDFGGQEIMHATHQFFLTQRSLYLLVLNRRQGGADREADYWFRLIRAFGGKDAPVIVVLNKQKSEPFDVNRGAWLEKYTGNIKSFVETDCRDSNSIMVLKRRIQDEMKNLKSIQSSFPRRWFAIKDELSQMGKRFITFEEYRSICRKHKEDDPENQTSLAGFLHDLGIALNYKDDPRLRFAYVLKPEWVTEGIYALLHAFVKNNGLFSPSEAAKVLGPKGYSQEATYFILGLMEHFELCFSLGDAQQRVLIPQLLYDQQPDEVLTFRPANCLNFGYQYAILPEGLVPRFIVRTQHLSRATTRWKSGVILHDLTTGCRALVRADSTEAQVRVYIDGPEAGRRELLTIIRYNFDVIHSDYEFKPINLIFPQGVTERPLRLDDLEALAHSGAVSMPLVLNDRRVINPRIADLMEPVKPVSPPLKLFLSYSQTDERYVRELRKDLKLMERNGLIRTWYDRVLTAGAKWEPRILQEFNEANVIVCQLSPHFLDSDYCILTELPSVLQRKADGDAELIAYVLRDCAWRETEFRHFQILPRDAKHLWAWRDKDEYWRAVADGIQETLKILQKSIHLGSGNKALNDNRSGGTQRDQH